ncbi:MAG: ThiF family adenylyltransferase [Pirellulales bacterium]
MSPENDLPPELARYARQVRYTPFGIEGQKRLRRSAALVVGCGALGSVIANTLARAGVGTLRIVDRDFLELNNLQRQVLYDEADVAAGLPKAIAAANRLRTINSQIAIEPVVGDVTYTNIASLAEGAGVIVDGTDNFETRLLVNDYCVKHSLPWVYGGCVGAEGQTMAILPGETACLTCLLPEIPPPGTTPTCDTAGIMGPVVNVIASLQSMEALKILSGNQKDVSRTLTVIDLWQNRLRQIDLANLRDRGDCPTCGRREFPWLTGEKGSQSAILCGRNAVQLRSESSQELDLADLERRLSSVGRVTRNPFLLRLEVAEHVITQFPDGRAIVAGTDDIAKARTIYARYIGS